MRKVKETLSLGQIMQKAHKLYKPVKQLNAVEWAEKYRRLPSGTAEPGKFRTERTPYVREIMLAASDPKIHQITFVSAAQIGKTELLLNILGYSVMTKPGPIALMTPTLKLASDYSTERIDPLIEATPELKALFSEKKSRDQQNTRLSKKFIGGHLYIIASNSADDLRGRYIKTFLIDEIDAYKSSVGGEGDPVELIKPRMRTFPDRLLIAVSTPTVKGDSKIADMYSEGTQERYYTECPHCHEYNEIKFDDLEFSPVQIEKEGKITYRLNGDVVYKCPHCGAYSEESVMKAQPAKWIGGNPDAYEQGHRSFWLNAFLSPWLSWAEAVLTFLNTKDDPHRLQVTKNTIFGELWENRGAYSIDENDLYGRREDYGQNDDGSFIEVPDEVAYLTMAVDTQDSWFEYEVLGHGVAGETWGIKHGRILGRPDDPEVQDQLKQVINTPRYFKNKEAYLLPRITFIDSGGHYSTTVKQFCKGMLSHKCQVYPIKGQGGDNVSFVSPPKHVPISRKKKSTVLFVNIGVNEGKAIIMNDLSVERVGPRYCHFPINPEAGYDRNYFTGLISERLEWNPIKRKSEWKPVEGVKRNEPLDIRNYNLAAAEMIGLDPEQELARRRNPEKKKKTAPKPQRRVIKARL